MLAFILGLFIGATLGASLGVLIIGMLVSSADTDQQKPL